MSAEDGELDDFDNADDDFSPDGDFDVEDA